MKKKVYIETSVISYYTSRPSRDLVTAARQQVTQEWWEEMRQQFDSYISAIVTEQHGYECPVTCSSDELLGE